MNARPAAVAGTFYPGDPVELKRTVDELLALATPKPPAKAIIAPHAGYVYSGPIAASAFACARDRKIERVVLMGPAHRAYVQGIGTSSADVFRTPLGDVPIDRETIARLERLELVLPADRAHAPEHCLEVELPFLQVVLGSFELVPLVVGDATTEEVASVLDAVWGGDETLIVVSTDLSHYYDYETARRMDEETARAIVELRPEDLGSESACGRVPLRGFLAVARKRGMQIEKLDLRSSGDTAGRRGEVVGYGAFACR